MSGDDNNQTISPNGKTANKKLVVTMALDSTVGDNPPLVDNFTKDFS